MTDMIDVKGLPEEYIELLKGMVEQFRAQRRTEPGEEDIAFEVWPLGVKGRLTREEIYEDR